MRAGQLSLDEQMTCLRDALDRNQTLGAVLSGAAALNLPGWYLVAGCLCQTVWNVITGQPPEAGILDYDLVYFDPSDLSWEAEDAVIRAGNDLFAGLAAPVEIRNQARVRTVADLRPLRPVRRVQHGHPAQPGPRDARRLRNEDRAVAGAVARRDRPSVAGITRNRGKGCCHDRD